MSNAVKAMKNAVLRGLYGSRVEVCHYAKLHLTDEQLAELFSDAEFYEDFNNLPSIEVINADDNQIDADLTV